MERQKTGGCRFTDVLFENLEADPIRELKRVYLELDLTYHSAFEAEAIKFLDRNKNYRRNDYRLSREEKELICNGLADLVGFYDMSCKES